MKKSLIKGAVLGIVFVFSIILFSNMMNKDLMRDTVDMEQPSFPMMYMQLADTIVNPMYGYQKEMKEAFVRESVTPLSTRRDVVAVIKPYDNQIDTVIYEVLSADGKEIFEKGKLSNAKVEGEFQRIPFTLETPLLMNQEYTLKFTLECKDKEPIYYYTRLVQRAGLNASQYIKFVQDFYEKSLNKDAAQELTAYIGPDENVPVTDFTQITVHSNFDQITWGSLRPTLYRKAIPHINEINETTCSISMNYELTAEDSENNVEHYDVNEFYRMRYSQARVMLIDFERNAQQVFDGELPVVTSHGINLGVVNKDVQYMSNQNAEIIAFVQAGDLWSYNRSANKAAKILSFREKDVIDERMNNNDHGIKIVRVEENGDIDFVLYGYNSRGRNEGRMGVGVYHYRVSGNVVEELAFIQTTQGYDFIRDDIEKMSYVNKRNQLYMLLENNFYCIDFAKKNYEAILTDISSDNFVASKSQRNAAWMADDDNKMIVMQDLESGQILETRTEGEDLLKVLGFINEDLVYGIAQPDGLVTDEAGNVIFGMDTVKIQDIEGETLKAYFDKDTWFTGADVQEGLVELKRATWDGKAYVPTDSENIINNLQANEEAVNIHLSTNERKGIQLALDFSKSAKSKSMLVVTAKYEVPPTDDIIEINPVTSDEPVYYVYAGGRLESIQTKVNNAINHAEEKFGVVLNNQQQYIWERGNRPDRANLDLASIPQVVLDGTLDENALQEGLGDEYTVLNMTTCSLESALYQVGQKRAVVALTSTGEHVVIVGYDRFNTILYNIKTKETYYAGANDSRDIVFGPAGNVFVGYIKNLPETK